MLKQVVIVAIISSNLSPVCAQSNSKIETLCHGGAGIGHPLSKQEIQSVSIRARIRNSARKDISNHMQLPVKDLTLAAEKRILKEKYGKRNFSCLLAVEPLGSIASLEIEQTSGNSNIDRNAISLIRSAAPFNSAEGFSKTQLFLVEFPDLSVRQHPRLSAE